MLTFERGAVAKLSRHNKVHHLSVKQLGPVDSQFVSSLESKSGLKHTGSTLLDLYPETHISEEYVLPPRTRREIVSDITLRSNF